MAGEALVVWNDAKMKTLEASGASFANASMSLGTTNSYNVETDGDGYPDAQFVLKVTFTVLPAENSVIALCVQDLNLDGVDAEAPEITRPNSIGTFTLNNSLATQALKLMVQDVPRNARYYLYNVNSGQTVPAGWSLKVIPKTFKPAP